MKKICFLFGHSDAPESILLQIEEAVDRHYTKYGIRQFVVGSYGCFDLLAESAVRRVKKRHKDISLLLLTPYHPAQRPVQTPENFDDTYYPEGMEKVPHRFAIVRANRYMVQTADSVICYVYHPGNTRSLLCQAQKREEKGLLPVDNLARSLYALVMKGR